MSATVLIIDDEPGVIGAVADVLDDEGYQTLTARSGATGLELFESERPDVVFLDLPPARAGPSRVELQDESDQYSGIGAWDARLPRIVTGEVRMSCGS